jgi:hypothetical protein
MFVLLETSSTSAISEKLVILSNQGKIDGVLGLGFEV